MAKTTGWTKISGYLFLLGVIIAIIAGVLGSVIPYSTTILVVLGAIVGIMAAMGMGSISKEAGETFLMATIALLVTGIAGQGLAGIPMIGSYLNSIVQNIAIFIAPAVVILALEAIWRAGSVKF
jgi:hypothetical protein